MKDCENCRGTGLVGSGPEPWAHLGQVVTCPVCNGTGKVPSQQEPEQVNVDNTQPEPPEEAEKKSGEENVEEGVGDPSGMEPVDEPVL